MTPEEAVATVESAKTASIFGVPAEPKYRELKRLLHPDRFGRDKELVKRAESAIYKLDSLYASVSKNGIKHPVKIGDWVVSDPLAKGDIADLYRAESASEKGVLKIAQSAQDNDLILNERESLTLLHKQDDKSSIQFRQYLPKLLDGFTASGRAVNVLSLSETFIPLADLRKLYPLDFRHVVWMMNRAFSVLGYIHRNGVVHGAITPEHLLYEPASHNLCLVDWCYSSRQEKKIPAIVKAYRDAYPPEVLRKQQPSAATDLFMLAATLRGVADVPKRFRPLFDLCLVASPASRPQDAWVFQDRWRKMAEEVYGVPRFIPLVLPVQ